MTDADTRSDADIVRGALFAAKEAWFSGLRAEDGTVPVVMTADEFNNRIAPAVAALDRLVAERDDWREKAGGWRACAEDADGVLFVTRAEAAEAERDRLREALENILDVGRSATGYDELEGCIAIAIEALKKEAPDADACQHTDFHFDRSLCACGSMHNYCDDCGEKLEECFDADA